jgi:hypothetical protein
MRTRLDDAPTPPRSRLAGPCQPLHLLIRAEVSIFLAAPPHACQCPDNRGPLRGSPRCMRLGHPVKNVIGGAFDKAALKQHSSADCGHRDPDRQRHGCEGSPPPRRPAQGHPWQYRRKGKLRMVLGELSATYCKSEKAGSVDRRTEHYRRSKGPVHRLPGLFQRT